MEKNEDQLEQRFPMRREIKKGFQKVTSGISSKGISVQDKETQKTNHSFQMNDQTKADPKNFQDYDKESNEDENVERDNA